MVLRCLAPSPSFVAVAHVDTAPSQRPPRSASARCHSDGSARNAPSVWVSLLKRWRRTPSGSISTAMAGQRKPVYPSPRTLNVPSAAQCFRQACSPSGTSPSGSPVILLEGRSRLSTNHNGLSTGHAGRPHSQNHGRTCRGPCKSDGLRLFRAGRRSVKRLAKLSWRARGSGSTCTAEVDHPIRGYRVNPKSRSNPFAVAGPEGSAPTVSWISFDGDTYWVRLSATQGWPRTIRVTQGDVAGARL